MTELSTRQFILCCLFLGITSKLMSMPITVYQFAGKDAIFTIILSFLVEILITFLIALVIKKNPHTGLLELLKKNFGSIIAYTLIVILYLFIIVKLFFALDEIYTFFKESLYDYFSPLLFGIAMFFVIGYLSFKGARTIGRTLEILFPVILLGLAVTFVSNLEFLSFTTQLPYFTSGAGPMLDSTLKNIFYFGNSLPLLFFVGKVEINDKFVPKVVTAYSLLALFVIVFCFIFYDIMGYSTILALFALSDYSQYTPYILELQRLNWLSIIINITKLFCSTSILLYCLGQAGKMVVKTRSTFWPIVASFGINFAFASFVNYELDTIKYLVAHYLSYATLGIIAIVIILCIIICAKRSKNDKTLVQ